LASWHDLKTLLFAKQLGEKSPKFDGAPPPIIPELDHEDCECNESANHDDLHAEGQCFGICYVNARQQESTRRIVVWGLKANKTNNLLLVSKCLESGKTKTFRADRIKYCYDLNGEIFEPPYDFLVETFGLTQSQSQLVGSFQLPPSGNSNSRDEVYLRVRRLLKEELIVLSAMSECDGEVCFAETAEILNYVNKRAIGEQLEWTPEHEKKIQGYIRRIRPSDDNIIEALDHVASLPVDSQIRFASACKNVMLADGITHDAELDLLDLITEELFGC